MNLTLKRNIAGNDAPKHVRRRYKKTVLDLKWKDVAVPLMFTMSLSLCGLRFYPALALVVIFLINRFIKNRYDFLIMLGIMCTSRGLVPDDLLPVRFFDGLLVAAIIGLLVYHKDALTRKITLMTICYITFLVIMMFMSDESVPIQLLTFRDYASIVVFILPMWIFANKDFEIRRFFRSVLVFTLIICSFYVIDGLILNGWMLIPSDAGAPYPSTFDHPVISPFKFYFPRKYPSALYLLIISTYALARYYRFRWWQWGILAACLMVSRTITVIVGIMLTYVVFQGNFRQFFKTGVFAVLTVIAAYFVDISTGEHLRVASHVKQVAEVFVAEDDEDLAEFGSTRGAQVIPKYEYLVDHGKLMTGLGFLHPEKTTGSKYEINNDLYSDITANIESVGKATEVTQFNTVIHIGIIGLVLQAIYYLGMFFVLKKGKAQNSYFYLSTIMCASLMGIGGFTGLNTHEGLIWIGISLGITLMQHRRNVDDSPVLLEPEKAKAK